MGIKNYTVIGKPVKFKEAGTVNMFNYLNNKEHKNHKGKTDKIYDIFKNDNFIDNACKAVRNRNLEMIKARKGGRQLTSFSHSFMFSPPRGIKPSKKEWETIAKKVLGDLVDYMDFNPKELKKFLFVNIHEQENAHLNMLFGKVIGKKSIDWGNKRVSNLLKVSFTTHFDEVMETKFSDYKPKTQKPRTKAIYHFEELNKKLEELEVKEQKIKKIIKRFGTYIKRVIDAQQEKDKEKEQKNRELIKKNLKKIPEKQQNEVKKVIEDFGLFL